MTSLKVNEMLAGNIMREEMHLVKLNQGDHTRKSTPCHSFWKMMAKFYDSTATGTMGWTGANWS